MFRSWELRQHIDSRRSEARLGSTPARIRDNPSECGHLQAAIEPLEQRTLFSWPSAPFPAGELQSTLYVNQLGTAMVTGKQLLPGHEFGGYTTYFDDPGKASFQAVSKAPLAMAYYDGPGRPTQVAANPRTHGSGGITVPVSWEKDTIFLGVQPLAGNSTADYTLLVNGPAANVVRDIPISPGSDAGNHGGVITGVNDFDFLKFTIPAAGKWHVTVVPVVPRFPFTAPFDVTMNVFDAKGNPVGGTFTQSINAGGPGARESWFGSHLQAGATYYVRVDGQGDSEGRYNVRVGMRRRRPRKPPKPPSSPLQTVTPPLASELMTAAKQDKVWP